MLLVTIQREKKDWNVQKRNEMERKKNAPHTLNGMGGNDDETNFDATARNKHTDIFSLVRRIFVFASTHAKYICNNFSSSRQW